MTPSRMVRRLMCVGAACLFSTAASFGADDTPVGWCVAAPPADASLQRLTNAELIDRLQGLGMSCLDLPPQRAPTTGFGWLDGSIELSAPDTSIRINAPELRELIHRGASALPALLEHVSDARPTRMTFAVRQPRKPDAKPHFWFEDEYDSRALPVPAAAGAKKDARVPVPGPGYTVKVGDLCYVATGQIVNRRLFVFSYMGAGFDEHGRYKGGLVLNGAPFGFSYIDSPVETPALAAAVRSDWHDTDDRRLRESLRSDSAAGRESPGALQRLLVYYPSIGTAEVHARIREVLDQDGEVSFWPISHTVSAISAFWWDDLAKDLSALCRMAARQDRRFESFEDTRKNPLASGTADLLAMCTARLVHHADNARLRALVADEIERLRQQRAAFGGDSGSAYDYHLGRLEDVQRRLKGEPERESAKAKELPATPAPASMKVTLDRPQTMFGRWPMFGLRFGVSGIDPAEIAAARVRITTVRDDTGFALSPQLNPSFVHPAVGRVNNAVMNRNEPPSLVVTLSVPPGLAKRLVQLKGFVEIVVPSFDSGATIKLTRVAATRDAAIPSPALAQTHIGVIVFGAASCNQALSHSRSAEGPNGARSYGLRPIYRDFVIPKGAPPEIFKEAEFTDADIALGIDDPEERVISTELTAPDGSPLRYNHNGWYHASTNGGRRFDAFRLDPADIDSATLVLRLATEKALIRIPFDFSDVPLPE